MKWYKLYFVMLFGLSFWCQKEIAKGLIRINSWRCLSHIDDKNVYDATKISMSRNISFFIEKPSLIELACLKYK